MIMAYLNLHVPESNRRKHTDYMTLQEAAVCFIHDSCEDLRCDAGMARREEAENTFFGRSISENQIPYNQEKDTDRLCLEHAVKRFLCSGARQDAFDVYFCYLKMFAGDSGNTRRMLKMLSGSEADRSAQKARCRDVYTHSAYVFALGLAVFETIPAYQEAYMQFYRFKDRQKAAHHFIEYWGLSALFHETGYPSGEDKANAMIPDNCRSPFCQGETVIPLKMELHPLAYLLILCDALQCWDRSEEPFDCKLMFRENEIAAQYMYEAEDSGMAHSNALLEDIKKRIDTAALTITVSAESGNPESSCKEALMSGCSFMHLYDFAVVLDGRYQLAYDPAYNANPESFEKQFGEQEKARMEEGFCKLSLEYQLSNIGQAKAFTDYLHAIDMICTDQPVDYEPVMAFTPEELAVIAPMEHGRWLREHIEMGWIYGNPSKPERELVRQHKDMVPPEIMELEPAGILTEDKIRKNYARLNPEEQEKDSKPMECMLMLLRQYNGLRIYRLKSN